VGRISHLFRRTFGGRDRVRRLAVLLVKYGDTLSATCHPEMVSDYFEPGGSAADQRQWGTVHAAFWRSLEGPRAADDELDDWLTTQPGVTIHSHGGFAPERWAGDIDGRRFEFRERHGQWNIEIDHHPSGRFIQQVTGTEPDGTPICRDRELEVGEFIASGTTDAAGYGTTSIERAQFIIETIRTHLTRQSCSHYVDQLEEIDALLGVPAHWCPRCGAHLPDRWPPMGSEIPPGTSKASPAPMVPNSTRTWRSTSRPPRKLKRT
jgi:hypothetical protein